MRNVRRAQDRAQGTLTATPNAGQEGFLTESAHLSANWYESAIQQSQASMSHCDLCLRGAWTMQLRKVRISGGAGAGRCRDVGENGSSPIDARDESTGRAITVAPDPAGRFGNSVPQRRNGSRSRSSSSLRCKGA